MAVMLPTVRGCDVRIIGFVSYHQVVLPDGRVTFVPAVWEDRLVAANAVILPEPPVTVPIRRVPFWLVIFPP